GFAILRSQSPPTLNVQPRTPRAGGSFGPRLARHSARRASLGGQIKMVPTSWYVGLSAVLFVIGVLGVLVRRNPLVIFMSIEIILNAANLAFVAFGQQHGSVDGQALVFFVLCVAAAE